jgi:hypothetical protein
MNKNNLVGFIANYTLVGSFKEFQANLTKQALITTKLEEESMIKFEQFIHQCMHCIEHCMWRV